MGNIEAISFSKSRDDAELMKVQLIMKYVRFTCKLLSCFVSCK